MWMLFDPLYLMMLLPCMVISGLTSLWVKGAFKKYSRVPTRGGMSGAKVAQAILSWHGIDDVSVEEVGGFLSDHYDPSSKALRLSPRNYSGTSVSAVGIAAHEVGHAIQHAEAYAFLTIRSKMVPAVQFSSNFSWWFIMLGVFLQIQGLALAGVILFAVATLFSIVTLPVEFDASRRAMNTLREGRILVGEELTGAGRVLRAAAATYIAAAITAIVQLLYFLIRSGLLGGGDD
jgi:Zn-dependent membrane protease YugP